MYDDIQAVLKRNLPATVMAVDPEIRAESDEFLVVLRLVPGGHNDDPATQKKAEEDLIDLRRGETRWIRMRLARHINRMTGKVVSWGMQVGETTTLFTDNTEPVMTRLGRDDRHVLDILVATGIAATRSGALSYVMRTFTEEHQEWLSEVDEAIGKVTKLREKLRPQERKGAPLSAHEESQTI